MSSEEGTKNERVAPVRTKRRHRSARRAKESSWWFVFALAIGGLLLTPIVYYLVGVLMFEHQAGYSEEGDGFRCAIVAMYIAPVAGLLWAFAGGLMLRPGRRQASRWLIAIGVYLAVGCLLQLAVASGAS